MLNILILLSFLITSLFNEREDKYDSMVLNVSNVDGILK